MWKTSRNSLIDRLRWIDLFKTPYLQILDERNFVRESNEVLGDSWDFRGERWCNCTVWRVRFFTRYRIDVPLRCRNILADNAWDTFC